jgi:signal transduction histidine kinase
MIGSLRKKPTAATPHTPCGDRPTDASPLAGDRLSIAHEIHDGFVQDAFAAKMLLDSVLAVGRLTDGETRRQLQSAMQLMDKALRESRRLIRGTRLAELETLGAIRAINNLIDELPPDAPTIRLVTDVDCERLDYATKVAVFRIVQQALNNICRHSRAMRADVRLYRKKDRLRLEIEDWGVGFDPARVNEDRFGLLGIRQRARLLGGRSKIKSAPGEGTRIIVELPLANDAEQ